MKSLAYYPLNCFLLITIFEKDWYLAMHCPDPPHLAKGSQGAPPILAALGNTWCIQEEWEESGACTLVGMGEGLLPA